MFKKMVFTENGFCDVDMLTAYPDMANFAAVCQVDKENDVVMFDPTNTTIYKVDSLDAGRATWNICFKQQPRQLVYSDAEPVFLTMHAKIKLSKAGVYQPNEVLSSRVVVFRQRSEDFVRHQAHKQIKLKASTLQYLFVPTERMKVTNGFKITRGLACYLTSLGANLAEVPVVVYTNGSNKLIDLSNEDVSRNRLVFAGRGMYDLILDEPGEYFQISGCVKLNKCPDILNFGV